MTLLLESVEAQRDEVKRARKAGKHGEALRLITQYGSPEHLSPVLGHELGLVLMALHRYEEARDTFLLVAQTVEDQSAPWFQAGGCSAALGEYEVAKVCYQKAIECGGARDQCAPYFAMGGALFALGQNDLALHWWNEGLAKSCDSPEVRRQRGRVKLVMGDYESGWVDTVEGGERMGARAPAIQQHYGDPETLPPEWDGESDGTLIVYADQGAGDAIQFHRYLRHLANRFFLAVGQPLKKLLGGWHQIPRHEAQWSTSLSALPYTLKRYQPEPPNAPVWTKPKNRKPKIGVTWYGSTGYAAHMDRNCPFDPRPILSSYRWDTYSLQQGVDFQSPDYAWNAEYLRQFDAVVTVDTSTLHLSATLGVPTVLIPQCQPFWYTGYEGSTTPWYPSVTMVRRKDVNDWESAWNNAKLALLEIL